MAPKSPNFGMHFITQLKVPIVFEFLHYFEILLLNYFEDFEAHVLSLNASTLISLRSKYKTIMEISII